MGIVNGDEEDKDVKDMLDNPVDNGMKNEEAENEMDVSEKIMNDFANIAIESGKTKEETDANDTGNVNEIVVDEDEQQSTVDTNENVDTSNDQEDTNEDEV